MDLSQTQAKIIAHLLRRAYSHYRKGYQCDVFLSEIIPDENERKLFLEEFNQWWNEEPEHWTNQLEGYILMDFFAELLEGAVKDESSA